MNFSTAFFTSLGRSMSLIDDALKSPSVRTFKRLSSSELEAMSFAIRKSFTMSSMFSAAFLLISSEAATFSMIFPEISSISLLSAVCLRLFSSSDFFWSRRSFDSSSTSTVKSSYVSTTAAHFPLQSEMSLSYSFPALPNVMTFLMIPGFSGFEDFAFSYSPFMFESVVLHSFMWLS